MTAGRAASRARPAPRSETSRSRKPSAHRYGFDSAPNLSKLGHLPRPCGLAGPIAVKAALPRRTGGIRGPLAIGLHGDAQWLGDRSRLPAGDKGDADMG